MNCIYNSYGKLLLLFKNSNELCVLIILPFHMVVFLQTGFIYPCAWQLKSND